MLGSVSFWKLCHVGMCIIYGASYLSTVTVCGCVTITGMDNCLAFHILIKINTGRNSFIMSTRYF